MEIDNQITFKLHNGIFKNFCQKALKNTVVGKKNIKFEESYEKFIDDLAQKKVELQKQGNNEKFLLSTNEKRECIVNVSVLSGNSIFQEFDNRAEYQKKAVLSKEHLQNYIVNNIIPPFWAAYYKSVKEYFKNEYSFVINDALQNESDSSPYVFIIDEINRGEISKIFGELFFSIDPDYRGEKGRVSTQYTNLIPEGDIFKDGFYIPENVYIIGTMNDIDRSVESFDFAMRRRFTWIEITAEQSALNMKLPEPTKLYMERINKRIEEISGLGSSYKLGASYFLNKDNAGNLIEPDYNKLWKLKIKPLLKDYIRGLPKEEYLLDELEKTYNG